MCFIEDNKNFITIRLHAEMKGLSDDEKLIKYELIKADTRNRLKASYGKCANKLDFYNEIFDVLSFFESDYLMLNLFLEKGTNHLFTFLSPNSFNNLNLVNPESISFKFWSYMSKHSYEDPISEFLKIQFIDLLNIPERHWRDKNQTNNPVINGYGNWIIESIENEWNNDKIISTYFLFSKFWNQFSINYEKFNKKEIIFYNKINQKFDDLKNQGIYINLNKLIKEIKENQKDLFINETINFPLLDDNDNDSEGYLNQRNRFNERVKQSKILCSSFINNSFSDIFRLMLKEEKTVCDKLYQNDIVGKLNEFQLPDSEQIRDINEIEGEENIDKLKKDFFRRLYLFEQL